MFGFMRRSGARAPSAALRRAIEVDGLPPGIGHASELAAVESRGRYAGRTVTYFRLFEPARAAELGLSVRAFGDLDTHPQLVLRSGRIEADGSIVITERAPLPDRAAPSRERAARSGRGDDEHLVFGADHR